MGAARDVSVESSCQLAHSQLKSYSSNSPAIKKSLFPGFCYTEHQSDLAWLNLMLIQ